MNIELYNQLLKDYQALEAKVSGAPAARQRVLRALRPIHTAWVRSLQVDGPGDAASPGLVPAFDPGQADQVLDALLSDDEGTALAAAEHLTALHLATSVSHLPIVTRDHQDATAEMAAEMQTEKDALVAAIRVLICQQLAMAVKSNPNLLANQLLQSHIDEIRTMAGKPVPAIALKELDPNFVKTYIQAERVRSQLAERDTIPEREKEFLKAIGAGAHTQRNLSRALEKSQQGMSKSVDLEHLIQKGYVEQVEIDTGVPGDRVRLYLLTESGQGLYRAIFGTDPKVSQAQKYLAEEENYGYRRMQGYWIDELAFQAASLGYASTPEKLRGIPGSQVSVQPDLLVHRKDFDVPVQIELGEKSWSSQRSQVVIGIFKCLAAWGVCDVWVVTEAMVTTLSNELTGTKDPKDMTGGVPLQAPAEVRFYILGGKKVRQFGDWPRTNTDEVFKTLGFSGI